MTPREWVLVTAPAWGPLLFLGVVFVAIVVLRRWRRRRLWRQTMRGVRGLR